MDSKSVFVVKQFFLHFASFYSHYREALSCTVVCIYVKTVAVPMDFQQLKLECCQACKGHQGGDTRMSPLAMLPWESVLAAQGAC